MKRANRLELDGAVTQVSLHTSIAISWENETRHELSLPVAPSPDNYALRNDNIGHDLSFHRAARTALRQCVGAGPRHSAQRRTVGAQSGGEAVVFSSGGLRAGERRRGDFPNERRRHLRGAADVPAALSQSQSQRLGAHPRPENCPSRSAALRPGAPYDKSRCQGRPRGRSHCLRPTSLHRDPAFAGGTGRADARNHAGNPTRSGRTPARHPASHACALHQPPRPRGPAPP